MTGIERITIRGFKSIRVLEDFELRPLNVLIGPNGSGKSNLLEAFRMFRAIAGSSLQHFSGEEGGPDGLLHGGRKRTTEIEASVTFCGGHFSYGVTLIPVGRTFQFSAEHVHPRPNLGPEAGRKTREYTERVLGLTGGNFESIICTEELGEFAKFALPGMLDWRVYHFQDTSEDSPLRRTVPARGNLAFLPKGWNLAPFLRRLKLKF